MRSDIIPEIGEKIKDGKTGCIVFDFGAYFPYDDEIVFRIGVGLEKFTDQKTNHRYPNKNYHTISRTYGRKTSKIGYPYYIDITELTEREEQIMLLDLEFGSPYEATSNSVFPLQLNLTKDKPVCGLSLRFIVEEWRFNFTSYQWQDKGWIPIRWSNVADSEGIIPLNIADTNYKKAVELYDTTIEPLACKPEHLIL